MSLIIVLDDGRSVEETHRQRMASAIRCHCLNQLELGGAIPQNRSGLPVMVDAVKGRLEMV